MAREFLPRSERPFHIEAAERIKTTRRERAYFYLKEFVNGLVFDIPNKFESLNREREDKNFSKKIAFAARLSGLFIASSALIAALVPTGGESMLRLP